MFLGHKEIMARPQTEKREELRREKRGRPQSLCNEDNKDFLHAYEVLAVGSLPLGLHTGCHKHLCNSIPVFPTSRRSVACSRRVQRCRRKISTQETFDNRTKRSSE